jgi:hypothetical protein
MITQRGLGVISVRMSLSSQKQEKTRCWRRRSMPSGASSLSSKLKMWSFLLEELCPPFLRTSLKMR